MNLNEKIKNILALKVMENIKFKISGFHCDACVRLATMKIKKIHCVKDVIIQPDGMAEVHAEREIPLAEFAEALKEAGYAVSAA